jgi:DNA polymerase-4
MNEVNFNPKPSTIMHIDLNSCFASIEQQANPLLRGKPIAVAAYTTPNGCIIAPSIEAKRLGIRVGMRVKEGKNLYRDLIILPPDPWKYRNVHLALKKLFSDYSTDLCPRSIDEFVLNLEGYLSLIKTPLKSTPSKVVAQYQSPIRVALEIKERIRKEVGEWLTVSIGISTNRFLAKLASSIRKPNGLDEINRDNFLKYYLKLKLTDLPYIKLRNAVRLNSLGIFTVTDFYRSSLWRLKAAFESINGYYWYLRLRGWEIDDVAFARRSYGNSYALPKPFMELSELSPILSRLTEKMGFRLRRAGYSALGVHVAVGYRDGSFWHKGVSFPQNLSDSRDIYKKAYGILALSPYKKPVRDLAVSCFDLKTRHELQLELFEDILKKENLVHAIDKVNEHWGNFIIAPARILSAIDAVPDRIAFGGVKELEEFTIG